MNNYKEKLQKIRDAYFDPKIFGVENYLVDDDIGFLLDIINSHEKRQDQLLGKLSELRSELGIEILKIVKA